jgi:hypothetical protein
MGSCAAATHAEEEARARCSCARCACAAGLSPPPLPPPLPLAPLPLPPPAPRAPHTQPDRATSLMPACPAHPTCALRPRLPASETGDGGAGASHSGPRRSAMHDESDSSPAPPPSPLSRRNANARSSLVGVPKCPRRSDDSRHQASASVLSPHALRVGETHTLRVSEVAAPDTRREGTSRVMGCSSAAKSMSSNGAEDAATAKQSAKLGKGLRPPTRVGSEGEGCVRERSRI